MVLGRPECPDVTYYPDYWDLPKVTEVTCTCLIGRNDILNLSSLNNLILDHKFETEGEQDVSYCFQRIKVPVAVN